MPPAPRVLLPYRLPVACALAALLLQLLLLRSMALPNLVALIPDDSFFYLRIAQFFWTSGGFTFDGVNPTYGFQPLWQLLMIGLEPFCGGPLGFLYAAVVLGALLHAATGVVLWRLLWQLGGSGAAVVGGLCWLANPAIWVWCWGLKENSLYAFCWLLALQNLQQQLVAGPGPRAGRWLGLWLGLAVFARINALAPALLSLAVLLLWPGAGSWRSRLLAALQALLVALLVAGPWYAFAWWYFGAAMPTSGSWKLLVMQGEVTMRRQWEWLGAQHCWHAVAATPAYLGFLLRHGYGLLLPALVVLLPVGLLGRLFAGALGNAALPVLGLVLAAALVSAGSNVLLLESYLSYANWYAVTEFVAVPLLAGLAAAAALRWLRPRWARAGLLVLAVFACLVPQWRHAGLAERLLRDLLPQPPQHVQLLEMGLWLRRHLPAETAIGCWDPGIVSYFRGGRTVSFDPLMNSRDYQRDFTADPFGFPARYVEAQQVAYMVGASVVGEPTRFGALPELPGASEPAAEVVWQPYPDQHLGWSERRWFLLVRPGRTPAADSLSADAFPFGILYPNDPKRRRWLTGDRDRLRAGLDWQGDVLRLQLALPPAGRLALQLGAESRQLLPDDNGWLCLDLRRYRGQRLQLPLADEQLDWVPQAQLIDYRL